MKMGQPDVLTYTEFLSQLPSGSIVACDPKLMGAKTWITLEEKLFEVGVNLTSLSQNLIDEVWTEDNGRPPVNVRFAKFSCFSVRILEEFPHHPQNSWQEKLPSYLWSAH